MSSLVVSDGMRIQHANDPPGQHCVYITPGDHANEFYRLSTFQNFPRNTSVDPRALAKFGFYYTGYGDRVKCFSCGIVVEDWTFTDDPKHPRWHTTQCSFTTQRQNNTTNRNPNETQSAGPSRQNDTYTDLFPCNNPASPHMRCSSARMQTFQDHRNSWPSSRIRATPAEMVEAGLFYLGERDRVKCWNCNGGLQNWDYNDSPWFEHAKWFPMCEYVLQQKGIEYVQNVTAQFPNISRPPILNPFDVTRPAATRQQRRTGPEIIDPKENMTAIKNKVEHEMTASELVTQAQEMGLDRMNIRRALTNRFLATQTFFVTLVSLVEAILDLPASEAEQSHDGSEASLRSTPGSPEDELREQLRQLEREKLCRKCNRSPATVVFLPCGHLVACVTCANDVTNCPLCHVRVNETVKSFVV